MSDSTSAAPAGPVPDPPALPVPLLSAVCAAVGRSMGVSGEGRISAGRR
ncbi:hypothetical protein [Streptomyces sp. NRRL S-237]|nr:hypothetical protein [Streptomyces sp. NRRL S-237]